MQWLRLTAIGGVVAFVTGCATSPATKVPPEAIEIAALDVRTELRFLGPQEQKRFLSDPAELQKLVETLYFRRRMTQLADEYGAGDDARLQALMRRDREYRLAEWVPRRFLETLEVPDLTEEARAYYDAHPEEFTPKEALHLQSIFLQANDDKAKVKRRREAEALLAKLRAGADFGELAEKHSEDGARFVRGDIGNNIMRGDLFPEVEPAAFALKVGELSDVVESPYGFHIFKLLSRREPVVLPYERTEEPILENLRAQYREKALRDWMDQKAPASAARLDRETLERMAGELREELEITVTSQGDDG
jgi:peptidyl-prolyl cis-trans isomerase C